MHKEIESVFSRSENSECMRGELCEQETSFGQAFIKTINKIQNTYAHSVHYAQRKKRKRLVFEHWHWHSQMFALHVFHFMFHGRIFQIVDLASDGNCWPFLLLLPSNFPGQFAFGVVQDFLARNGGKICIFLLANGNSQPGTQKWHHTTRLGIHGMHRIAYRKIDERQYFLKKYVRTCAFSVIFNFNKIGNDIT